MGRAIPLTDDERAAILADLRAGERPSAVAAKHGRGKETVRRLARSINLAGATQAQNMAAAAQRDWALAERVGLLNRAFAKAEEVLERITRPGELQAFSIAVGVLIDKRRLEDGEATSRSEVTNVGARDRIARRLDELAARAGAGEAPGGPH